MIAIAVGRSTISIFLLETLTRIVVFFCNFLPAATPIWHHPDALVSDEATLACELRNVATLISQRPRRHLPELNFPAAVSPDPLGSSSQERLISPPARPPTRRRSLPRPAFCSLSGPNSM